MKTREIIYILTLIALMLWAVIVSSEIKKTQREVNNMYILIERCENKAVEHDKALYFLDRGLKEKGIIIRYEEQ